MPRRPVVGERLAYPGLGCLARTPYLTSSRFGDAASGSGHSESSDSAASCGWLYEWLDSYSSLALLRSRRGSLAHMKFIIAIIQPNRLEDVKAALTEVEVFRLTVMDCQGFGRQKGQTEVYRGHEFTVNLLRKVQLQIAVNEEFVEPTIQAILKGARTGEKGEIGDGKIFVLPLEDCLRIRTGERGSEAI